MRHLISPSLDRGAIVQQIHDEGYALAQGVTLAALASASMLSLDPLCASWNALPPDTYLKDGGRYRARRHASMVQTLATNTLTDAPHRAHWQPVDYNALHGGIERWFEPVTPAVNQAPAWRAMIASLGQLFADCATVKPEKWFIEAHQFRIDTASGVGRPTPEGAHRDGVDFVAVILVQRGDMKGGETRVFEADGPRGIRFTLSEPWSALLLDDARVIHETTPIQPGATAGVRDTLVITYRHGSFQDPN